MPQSPSPCVLPGQIHGHSLLPRWKPLLQALPRLGPVGVFSRNEHAVTLTTCRYPQPADPNAASEVQFMPVLKHWRESWYYQELVNGQELTGIEFRDENEMGFHKIAFSEQSDHGFAQQMLRAFEQEPLSKERIQTAFKTNQLDGVCCPSCHSHVRSESCRILAPVRALVQSAIARRSPIRFILHHEALLTVLRFVPTGWCGRELWTAIEGARTTVFLRGYKLGRVDLVEVVLSDAGRCRVAKLRDETDLLVATMMFKDDDTEDC